MKTREQAEARAMELYPDEAYRNAIQVRKAFLQCWEEMQSIRNSTQTTDNGFNVSERKQLLCEMMRKDEESQLINEQSSGNVNESVDNNELREAAEKVVVVNQIASIRVPIEL